MLAVVSTQPRFFIKKEKLFLYFQTIFSDNISALAPSLTKRRNKKEGEKRRKAKGKEKTKKKKGKGNRQEKGRGVRKYANYLGLDVGNAS